MSSKEALRVREPGEARPLAPGARADGEVGGGAKRTVVAAVAVVFGACLGDVVVEGYGAGVACAGYGGGLACAVTKTAC